MNKLKNEIFINKAKKIHGDKYNYDKVVYKNTRSKIEIVCKEHGVFEQIPDNHLQGKGCSKCSGNLKKNTEIFISDSIKVHGLIYNYGKVNYTNSHAKVILNCIKHGDFEISPTNHLRGQGCKKCSFLELNLKLKMSDDEFKNICENNKYSQVYDYSKIKYVNSKTKIKIGCPIHGIFEQLPPNHIRGKGCPKCVHKISKPEIEVQDFIKNLGYEIETNKRNIIFPYELDIYIPNLNLAIEFNGTYWHYNHTNKKCKPKGYHGMKSNFCREKGIKLLHIREDLWNRDKEKMKQVIKKLL